MSILSEARELYNKRIKPNLELIPQAASYAAKQVREGNETSRAISSAAKNVAKNFTEGRNARTEALYNVPGVKQTLQQLNTAPQRLTNPLEWARYIENFSRGMGERSIDFSQNTANTLMGLGSKISGLQNRPLSLDPIKSALYNPKYDVFERDPYYAGAGSFAFDQALLTGGADVIKGSKVLKPLQQALGKEAGSFYARGNPIVGKALAEISQSVPYTTMSAFLNFAEGGNIGEGVVSDIVIDTIVGQILGKNFGKKGAKVSNNAIEKIRGAIRERNEEMLDDAIRFAKKQGVEVNDAIIPQIKSIMNQSGTMGGLSAKSFEGLSEKQLTKKLTQKGAYSNIQDKGIRFFISDKQANLKRGNLKEAVDRGYGTLDEIFVHPKLFKEYPHLKNIAVRFDPNVRGSGYFDEVSGTITLNPNNTNLQTLGTLIHENQHVIQTIEGFSKGGSTDLLGKQGYKNTYAELEARAAETNRVITQFKGKNRDFVYEQAIKEGVDPKDIVVRPRGAYGGISAKEEIASILPNKDPSQWSIEDMRDIGNTAKGFKDVYRNFEKVFGDQFPKVKKLILDPFDTAKNNFVDMQNQYLDELDNKVIKGFGIKKGSKLSGIVQKYGEGVISDEEWQSLSKSDQSKVIDADKFFREKYDELLTTVNGKIAQIYPDQPDKLIPKRQDYYRHFKEMREGIGGLLNIFDTPANIPSELVNISEYTKPKQKFLSIAQKRLGGETDYDAVGGYLNYLRQATYATHIDPEISKFRSLAKDLEELTNKEARPADVGKLNNFLWFLREYANSLAGKTNPLDRQIQELIPGGRTTFRAMSWLNRRVKTNVILGNISSALAQPFNIPQAAADMGYTNYARGVGKSLAEILDADTAIKKSGFIKERYFKGYAKFDSGILNNTKKFAAWITGVLDEVSTKTIWNGYYNKALTENINNPVKYADDLTRKMVAGRGVGEVPIAQQSKLFQLVAPFQLEVGNLWNVFGDWVGSKGAASKMVKFSVAAFLMNRAVKEIRGSDVTFDPIQATLEAYTELKEGKPASAAGRLAGEVLSNVPFGQSVAAAYPEEGLRYGGVELPSRSEFFGEGDPTKYGSGLLAAQAFADPLYKLIPPFGGQQLKRSVEGGKTYSQGYSETPSGRTRFEVEKGPLSMARYLTLGQYSTPEARKYFESLGKSKAEVLLEKLENEPIEKQNEMMAQLMEGDKQLYNQVVLKKKDEVLKITDREKQIRNLPVKDGSRARALAKILKKMDEQEQNEYMKRMLDLKVVSENVLEQLKELKREGGI